MEENNFQKKLKEEYKKEIECLEEQIKANKEHYEGLINAGKIGSKVRIKTSYKFSVIETENGDWQLSDPLDKKKLLNMILENEWNLIEVKNI